MTATKPRRPLSTSPHQHPVSHRNGPMLSGRELQIKVLWKSLRLLCPLYPLPPRHLCLPLLPCPLYPLPPCRHYLPLLPCPLYLRLLPRHHYHLLLQNHRSLRHQQRHHPGGVTLKKSGTLILLPLSRRSVRTGELRRYELGVRRPHHLPPLIQMLHNHLSGAVLTLRIVDPRRVLLVPTTRDRSPTHLRVVVKHTPHLLGHPTSVRRVIACFRNLEAVSCPLLHHQSRVTIPLQRKRTSSGARLHLLQS